jgi:hypothetical protein
MLGFTLSVLPANCTRYSTEDTARIVNSFIYNPNHTYLQSHTIIYYAATRLNNYNRYPFVTSHLFHSCTYTQFTCATL